tara:strand:- start:6271 stop:7344 length:1074 start_codon:yes stop_codon:yes gene_type:complete
MAPKSDKKFSEVFDAAEKASQFLQNKKNIISGLALGAATTPLGLPGNQIVDGIRNTVGNIQAASSFANSNPQIQNVLNNEYTGLAAGFNPVAGAAYMFGKGSQLAPVATKAVSDFFETTKTKKPESKNTYPTVAELQTIKPSRDYQKEKEIETNSNNTATGPRLDPNATERYASNFKAGQANMGNIQDMYASNKAEDQYKDTGKTALQLWAEANPALAQKEFAKAEAKAVKSGKASSAYDSVETFKPSDIPEADRQNPVEQASALGGNLTKDAQAFKDDAMAALLGNYGNENIKPIVEGLTIPTTTNYAGAFNQADTPDLQSMINMGDQLGNYGIESPLFSQGQKFKDLFQNSVLGK